MTDVNDDLRFGPDFRYDEILDEDGNPIAGLDIDDEPRLANTATDTFHLAGTVNDHDQSTHGNRSGVSGAITLDKTNADRAWADREGNNRLSGQGDCYVAAYQAMETGPRHRLVHGVVAGQGDLEGVRFDHAWVERRDELPSGTVDRFSPEQIAMLNEANVMVIDRSNGNNIEMPRQLYYAIGQVDSNTVARYTYEEMARNMVEYKHYGPWDGDHTHDS